MERIAAWLMWLGVLKSGSPTPSEITPSVVSISSKNLRMPEAETWSSLEDMEPRLADRPAASMAAVYVTVTFMRNISVIDMTLRLSVKTAYQVLGMKFEVV